MNEDQLNRNIKEIKEILDNPDHFDVGERKAILMEELLERGIIQINADEPLATLLKTYFTGVEPVDERLLVYELSATTGISEQFLNKTL